MSRFKRIKNKSNKKSSVSIDEKIAALNKQLKKTGMLSEEPTMTTSNIYPEVSETPNQDLIDFEAIMTGGQRLGFSGADGNTAGNASLGDVSGLSGVALSPPHPVTGVRNSAAHVRDGTGGTTPLRPGKTTTRGFSDNPPVYTMGSCLWFYDSDFNNGAGQPAGKWCNLEFSNFEGETNGKWFFWDTIKPPSTLAGFYFANTDLSQHPCGDISDLIDGLNFPNGSLGPEKLPVLTQKGLETEPIYPGPIANLFGLGARAFEWMKGKAEEAIQAIDDFFSPVEAYLDATAPFLGFLAHQVNPNSPYNEENPFPVEIAEDQKEEIKNEIEEIFNEWGSERVEEINNGSPMTNEEMKQVNEKINRNIKTGGNDATDSKFPSYRLTVNNIGNPNAFEGNIKTNKDGSQTPTAIEDNYVFEGDDDAAAPGAPTIIKTLLNNKGVQEAIKNSGLSYPYRVDDSPLPVGEKPILQNKNMPIKLNLTTPFDGMFEEKKPLSESAKLGHFEPDILNVDIKNIRKGIMPEYPKQPPAEMIDGYHQKSPLRPKPLDNEPYVKITKVDLIRNHRIKQSEVDEMMDTINRLNDYIKKHPEDLIHAQQRYPVDDPRLAELNWKMDQMLEAGQEYLDSNFKVNEKLFKRAMDRTKNNIKVTDPKYVQQHYDELRGTMKSKPTINRKSPSRFFKKPVRKKSSMEEINDKIKKLDKDLLI